MILRQSIAEGRWRFKPALLRGLNPRPESRPYDFGGLPPLDILVRPPDVGDRLSLADTLRSLEGSISEADPAMPAKALSMVILIALSRPAGAFLWCG